MLLKYRDVSLNKKVQEDFNNKVFSYLKDDTLEKEELFKGVMTCVHNCVRCSNVRKKITPIYTDNIEAVLIGRVSTKKDIKSESIFDRSHSSYSLLKRLLLILSIDINNTYYTNSCFCIAPTVSDLTADNLNKCYLFKYLELKSLNLPKIIFLLGNDSYNLFFNTSYSTHKILGTFYISEFLGERRLFVPIPHPVNLLRDKELLTITEKELRVLNKALPKIKEELL